VTRAFFVNNEIYMAFLLILKRKVYLVKRIIYPNTIARSPMQLHRLKAGPGCGLEKEMDVVLNLHSWKWRKYSVLVLKHTSLVSN